MRRVHLLVFVLFCTSCNSMKILGTYNSTCILYGYPSLVVKFNSDSTFTYKMPYVEEISGVWSVKNDTLLLHSDKFSNLPPSEVKPADEYNKYTNLDGKIDAYLVKGNKLYTINKEGYTKNCYLKKQ